MSKKKEAPKSGIRRVTIRMPSDLHKALLRRRDETDESLNDMLVAATARLLGLPVPEIQKGIPGRKPGRGVKRGRCLGEGGTQSK
ncbi:MAG TPA: hypothetical protein VKD72_19245 [Gemmataceae bacterium]|nr:hypothetical protein [Gemmataceae bacterium]